MRKLDRDKAILFFDIDETLVNKATGNVVPPETIQALIKAKENGHLIFINTGRTWCAVTSEIREVPFDGFLCGCGIHLLYHGETLYERHLPLEAANKLAKVVLNGNMDAIFEGADDVYFPVKEPRFQRMKDIEEARFSRGLGLKHRIDEGNIPYDKIFVVTDENSDLETLFAAMGEYMEYIDRGENSYELILKGDSKKTAIERIQKEFSCEKDQLYAFGDSANDLPMFLAVGHAIAMEEHQEELDPYTEFVTKKVEDDGIAHALRHYGLID